MKKSTLIIIQFIFCQLLFGQNYIAYYNHIENAFSKGILNDEYKLAISYFDSAFACADPFSQDLYYASISHVRTGEFEKGLEYLSKAIKQGIDTSQLKIDSNIFSHIPNFEKYNFQTESLFFIDSVCDTELLKTVDSLMVLDQKYRKELPLLKTGSLAFKEKESEMKQQDSLNWLALQQIIVKNGWPGFNRLSNNRAFPLLMHLDWSSFIQSESLFLSEIEKGNLEPYLYAAKIDLYSFSMEGKIVYRSYLPGPIQFDTEEMQLNRRKIGALSYNVLVKRNDLIHNKIKPVSQ
ncbi:MAG: hypothetical protein AB7S69_18330 [Salinivirgaceae bacterium]|jgi:hypothetical protein